MDKQRGIGTIFNIKGVDKMIVKCKAEDCIDNKNGICTREKIEIDKTNAYDDNCAECQNYYKEK